MSTATVSTATVSTATVSRRARSLAAVALVASAILLSACSTVPEPVFGAKDKAAIRSRILDRNWETIASEYPEAIRPDIGNSRTVADHDWNDVMIACLRESGIVADASEGLVGYTRSNGQTQLEVAVHFYSCAASNQSVSEITPFLDRAKTLALYDYYLNTVRPCLLSIGANSPRSPDLSAARGPEGLGGWNPYQTIWVTGVSTQTVRYLEQRCPPTPAWLNLGG